MLNEREIKSQYIVINLSQEVIPDKVISLFNFAAESLANWTNSVSANGDLVTFMSELYNESTLILKENGDISTSDERLRHNITNQKFKQGIEKSCAFAEQFTTYAVNAVPAPAATYKAIDPDYFFDNVDFGKTLKYIVAWDNLCRNVLAENAFFSQAHLLESRTDIAASVDMATRFYYKQSFQILRGFLESAVLPIHFFNQPNEFEKWRSNNYRNRPLRGTTGLLNKLTNLGLISNNLSDDVSNLYQQLNGSIHGGEKYLIHKGVYQNTWSGLIFKEQDFLDWCTAISKAVEVGAKLLQINVKQLMSLRGNSDVVCVNCHNDKDLKLEEFIFGGRNFKQYSCSICGHQSIFDEQGHLSHKVTGYKSKQG